MDAAITSGDYATAIALCAQGASPNHETPSGETLLMRAVEAHTLLVRETAAAATAATAATADVSTTGSIDSSSTVVSLSSAQLLQLQQAQSVPPLKLLLERGVHRPRVGYEGHVRQHTALT
eukprot:1609-Heterococcus_DN1.PRE.1